MKTILVLTLLLGVLSRVEAGGDTSRLQVHVSPFGGIVRVSLGRDFLPVSERP